MAIELKGAGGKSAPFGYSIEYILNILFDMVYL